MDDKTILGLAHARIVSLGWACLPELRPTERRLSSGAEHVLHLTFPTLSLHISAVIAADEDVENLFKDAAAGAAERGVILGPVRARKIEHLRPK